MFPRGEHPLRMCLIASTTTEGTVMYHHHPEHEPQRDADDRSRIEPLYRFEAALTETVPVGLIPEGVRLDPHFDGEATAGTLAGARVRGIDYLLLRGDGVGVIDANLTLEADGGRVVSAHAQGYIVPPEGVELPPPDVLLSPDFMWPDVRLPIHGFALYQTGASELMHLNHTAASFQGYVNVGRGELVVEARELSTASDPVAAG